MHIFGDDSLPSTDPQSSDEKKKKTTVVVEEEEKFVLNSGDMVFPICHAGQNRSQVLWQVFNDVNLVCNNCMQVVKPHGAESGFDPCVTGYHADAKCATTG